MCSAKGGSIMTTKRTFHFRGPNTPEGGLCPQPNCSPGALSPGLQDAPTERGGYKMRRRDVAYLDGTIYCLVNGNATNLWADSGNYLIVGLGMITNQACAFTTGGYTQTPNSPGVDSALDIGVAIDVLGNLRPRFLRQGYSGSGFDMGAYESMPPPGAVFKIR